MPHIFFMLHYTIFCVFSQVKKTIQEHKGDLEAAEAACAETGCRRRNFAFNFFKTQKKAIEFWHWNFAVFAEEGGRVWQCIKRYYQGSTTVHFIQVSIFQLRQTAYWRCPRPSLRRQDLASTTLFLSSWNTVTMKCLLPLLRLLQYQQHSSLYLANAMQWGQVLHRH